MKTIRYLLIFYAVFLIAIAPALRIAGPLFDTTLISLKGYLWAVMFFIVAMILYLGRKEKE